MTPMRGIIAASALMVLAACASGPRGPGELRAGGAPQVRSGLIGATHVVSTGGLLIAGFDANGDAAVDRAELAAGAARAFSAADADGSGGVTPVEHGNWAQIWLGSRSAVPGWITFDNNLDNDITPAEFNDTLDDLFTRLDQDKNGSVTRSELLSERPARPRRGDGGERPPR